ncbi:MAG: 2-hydroxychromene-2-carboxylate isomerase [Minwuia sp.]|nr:2-hydroxychromene-2-carboxylate isomerase [Minwuia sp.]
MTQQQVDYFGALGSPWTYLGHERLTAMASMAGAKIRFCPINLLPVFDQTGGLPLPKRAPARRAYRMQELKRWRAKLERPLTLEPKFFPANETEAALLTITARETGGDDLVLAGGFMRAVWAEDRDISDAATIDAIIAEAGMDAADLRARMADVDPAAIRGRETAEALERGVFGAPTYHFGDEMFWGQDRLDFVERKLRG